MTTKLDTSPSGDVEPVLDLLDPDLETLFDEVEQILRRTLTETVATAARLRAPARFPLRTYARRWSRGRRPEAGRATQRGPPTRRPDEPNAVRPWRIRCRREESEVMPVADTSRCLPFVGGSGPATGPTLPRSSRGTSPTSSHERRRFPR